ncbi:MAG: ABC transporter permease [Phycisphaerae bacterium]|nr:ABC transporter permease [Phycisphaerae bacterium]
MRAAWRLATSSLFERPSRTALLTAVVVAAAVLIAAVGVAFGSLNHAVRQRVAAMVGNADLVLKRSGRGQSLDAALLDRVRGWPETRLARGRLSAPLALRFRRPVWSPEPDGSFKRSTLVLSVSADGVGIDPALERDLPTLQLLEGRLPGADDEIVLDKALVRRLSRPEARLGLGEVGIRLLGGSTRDVGPMKADPGPERIPDKAQADRLNEGAGIAVGDWVEFARFRAAPVRLRVVGVASSPPLGGSVTGYMTMPGLAALSSRQGRLSQIDVVVREGLDPTAVADRRRPDLDEGLSLQTTQLITSGLDRNLRANQLGFFVASTMAFLAASFIIMTGLATGVTERQRELGILRCLGAARRTLAGTQLLVGGLIGTAGAAVGIPIGVAAAWLILDHFRDALDADVILPPGRLAFAFAGAVGAGLVGAAWPAWQAARTAPLKAMSVRSVPPSRRTLVLLAALGALGVLTHLSIITLLDDADTLFRTYVALGVPSIMSGYFLLGAPVVVLVARLGGPTIARIFALPRRLLGRTIAATPFRFGFTAGAMMLGLALMVAIWTQGGAVLRDWLDKIEFPDAFVVGLNLTPESQRVLDELPFVRRTCAISIQPVRSQRSFGISGFTEINTSFVAFEPEPFFEMVRLSWVKGDEAYARRRLAEGGAVLIAREFFTAGKLGVGDTFIATHNDRTHSFEVVGVVSSPGLELVNDFFKVEERFTEQTVHAVFGSRRDLREKFGSDAIGLIQIDLDDAVSDDEAIATIREVLLPAGILDAGSGRQIKRQITGIVRTSLVISSSVAAFAMFIACFGVANLIIAGVHARRFEFGVLRALGASRGLLARLVLAEAAVIAVAAGVLGTLMGLQGALGGTRLNRAIWGLELDALPPPGPIAIGWLAVFLFTLGAAGPTAAALSRKRPRELLGSVRG